MIAQWARRAAAGLRERQTEINRLNVFPIPDSDTGSNMAHTMTAAITSTNEADSSDPRTITAALARGAVRGARGNSGMVLSQVLRALADTASHGPVDGSAVAKMLQLSVEFVKNSIATPVEGTILTVLRAAADGATASKDSLSSAVAHALEAAERALENTPHQLDVLAKAGVVDAGGRGLVVILQSLADTLNGAPEGAKTLAAGAGSGVKAGEKVSGSAADSAAASPSFSSSSDESAEHFAQDTGKSSRVRELASSSKDEEPTHSGEETTASTAELEVMFMFDATARPSAIDDLKDLLERTGNSIVMAEAARDEVKVHVHTRQAAAVIEQSFGLGRVYDLRLEVLPDSELPAKPIIALAPQGGASQVFETAGAIALDMKRSEDKEIQELLAMTGTGSVILLTNGYDPSRILDFGYSLSAIETSSLVGGMAALAVHDPTNDFEDDLEDMADAVSAQRYAQTTAERMIEDLDELLAAGGELVTILWSSPEVDAASMEQLRQHLRTNHADVEFHDYRADGMGHAVEIGVE